MGTLSQRDALENSGEDEQQNRVSGSGKERECYQHTSELLQGCEWASVAKCYGGRRQASCTLQVCIPVCKRGVKIQPMNKCKTMYWRLQLLPLGSSHDLWISRAGGWDEGPCNPRKAGPCLDARGQPGTWLCGKCEPLPTLTLSLHRWADGEHHRLLDQQQGKCQVRGRR